MEERRLDPRVESLKQVVDEERSKSFDYLTYDPIAKTDAVAKKAKELGIPFKQYVSYSYGDDFGDWFNSFIKIGNEKVDVTFDTELADKLSTGKTGQRVIWDESFRIGKSWRDLLTSIAISIKNYVEGSRIINLYIGDPKRIYIYSPTDERALIKQICMEHGVKCNIKRKANGVSQIFVYG